MTPLPLPGDAAIAAPTLEAHLAARGADPALSALARAIGIERSTMVAVIDTLERRALVERRPSKVDRRSNALVLSTGGAALMDKLRPMVRAHEDCITGDLSPAERRLLIDLLRRLSDGPATK